MSKKTMIRFGAVACAASMAIAMSACSSGSSSSSSGSSSSADESIPKPNVSCDVPEANIDASKVDTSNVSGEITWMTQGLQKDFGPFFEGVIKQFEDENPGTKINWTDQGGAEDFDNLISTQAQGCKMADVINVPSSTIMALSSRDFLLDLDVKAPGSGDHILPDLWSGTALSKSGHHTAIPWYYGPFVTIYNKAVFERNGLDPEKVPATMDERFDAAAKIASSGKGDFALWGNPTWQISAEWLSMGVKIIDPDTKQFTFADDEKAVHWVEKMKELNDKGVIPPDSFTSEPDPGKAFNKGNLAFGTPNPAFIRNVKSNNAEVYATTGVGAYPKDADGKYNAGPQSIAVSVTTQNAPLAVKFAQYITSVEQLYNWTRNGGAVIMPPSQEALDKLQADPPEYTKDDPLMKKDYEEAIKAASQAETDPSSYYLTGKVQTTLSEAVVKGIRGEGDAKTVLKNAQDQMNQLVKQLGN